MNPLSQWLSGFFIVLILGPKSNELEQIIHVMEALQIACQDL